jgi:3-hydroxyisobutyrate dehydrogenase-like beta-hydroxyacid dehydrogenase
MARNIAAAGHELTVFNRSAEKMAPFLAQGASAADSPAELARRCELLALCVAAPADVREVFERQDGILAGLGAEHVVVDFSTIDPTTSRAMAARCADLGSCYLDAPVSGGVGGAEQGSLTVMVGGSPDALERARPVLESVGKNIQHVGPSGAGSTAKLINQMLVGVNLCGAVEALVLGTRAGLDPAHLYEIIRSSSGNSNSLNGVAPRVLDRNFEPGFALDLLFKDVDLAAGIARELRLPLLMASQALQLIQTARGQGLGERDTSATILPLERTAGLEVRRRETAT